MRRGLLAAVALSGALVLAPATALAAGPYARVYETYSTTGTVSACQYSATTLQAALRDTPSYAVEYDADFTYAVQAAIAARAGGFCSSAKSKLHGFKLALVDYGNPAPPSGVTSANGAGVPLPLVLLALLVAFALLGTAVISGSRVLGLDPRWAQAARHAMRETEYRLGDRSKPLRQPPAPSSRRRPQLPPAPGDDEPRQLRR